MWSFLLLAIPTTLTQQPLPHQKLIRDIMDDYDPMVRPVRDPRRAVNVTFRMTVYQLLDVNEALQSVSLYCWLIESWYDEFLNWTPEAYSGEKSTVVDASMVWRPDTYLYNNVDMEGEGRITSAIIRMKDGEPLRAHVSLQYPSILQYSCNMFLLYFPFDHQNCSMEFASWVYDITGIDYWPDANYAHMENFIPNSEWDIVSFKSKRVKKYYSCCPDPYVSVFYFLHMRRKPLFYVLNLILPTIIISTIAMVGFFFPSHTGGDREEKVSLGITTLLSMSVFLLMVSDELPTTSDFVPYIGWFYIGVILFIACATLTTSVVIVIQQQGRYGHKIPPWWRYIVFTKLARLTLLRPPVTLNPALMKKPQNKQRAESLLSLGDYELDENNSAAGEFLLNGPVGRVRNSEEKYHQSCCCNPRSPYFVPCAHFTPGANQDKSHTTTLTNRHDILPIDANTVDSNTSQKYTSDKTELMHINNRSSIANRNSCREDNNNINAGNSDNQNSNMQISTNNMHVSVKNSATDVKRTAISRRLSQEIVLLQRDLRALLEQWHDNEEQNAITLEWEWFASIIEQAILAVFLISLAVFVGFMMMSRHTNQM